MKRITSIYIESELLDEAKRADFSLSFIMEKAIKEIIKEKHKHKFKCFCGADKK